MRRRKNITLTSTIFIALLLVFAPIRHATCTSDGDGWRCTSIVGSLIPVMGVKREVEGSSVTDIRVRRVRVRRALWDRHAVSLVTHHGATDLPRRRTLARAERDLAELRSVIAGERQSASFTSGLEVLGLIAVLLVAAVAGLRRGTSP